MAINSEGVPLAVYRVRGDRRFESFTWLSSLWESTLKKTFRIAVSSLVVKQHPLHGSAREFESHLRRQFWHKNWPV